jgi:hypothetical protein
MQCDLLIYPQFGHLYNPVYHVRLWFNNGVNNLGKYDVIYFNQTCFPPVFFHYLSPSKTEGILRKFQKAI